jgi:hypothetical protein
MGYLNKKKDSMGLGYLQVVDDFNMSICFNYKGGKCRATSTFIEQDT